MRPFTRVFPSPISALGAHHDELAVLTDDGVELVSLSLETRGRIRGRAPDTDTLARLADGRWIAFRAGTFTRIHAGREGGELAPIWPGETFADAPVLTAKGFVATYQGRLWVDEGGPGRWVSHGVPGEVVGRDGDRLLLADSKGLGVIDVKGARIAHAEDPRFVRATAKVCAVAAGRFAMKHWGSLQVRSSDDLAVLATLPISPVHDAEELEGDLVISGGDRVSRWSWLAGERLWERELAGSVLAVNGGHIFLGARDADRFVVLDRHGDRVDEFALDAPVWRVALLDAGCVLTTGRGRAVWWRAPGDVVELLHDLGPERFVPFEGGLLTTEGRALHAWRPDAQGAAVPAVSTAMPMGEHLVVGGTLLRTVRLGHFRVVAEARGHQFAVDADAPFRPVVSRAEAAAIVERLVGRAPMGPAVTDAADEDELAQRPPVETAPLHAAALFDPSSLAPPVLSVVERARERFFAELAHALDVSPHTLLGAVRSGRFPLTGPRALVKPYEYVGSFESDGELWVADPWYFARRGEEEGALTSVKLAAQKGRFHAFLRRGSGALEHRTGELVVVHEDGFAASATSRAGSIGVTTGLAGVFDATCPPVNLDRHVDEGIQQDRGALSQSGFGDGGYPVYAARVGRKVVKIRIAFEDEAGPDRAVLAPPPGGRKYTASARFAVGESLEHAKFGSGVVESLTADGKIVVRFGDGPRTLVHAR
jgi:hypothetical protein